MKALQKALRGHRFLIFFDLEGTQFTHEMIEIGAYAVSLHEDGTVKGIGKSYSTYVKASHPIGDIVKQITGINEKTLQNKGVLFPTAFEGFRKFCSKYQGKCSYVTFGNHDLKIIHESVMASGEYGLQFEREIRKNYFDFSSFISTYIKDKNNNPLSLVHYLELFGVNFEGQAHDALADAKNLISLYDAFCKRPELVALRYEETLSQITHLPMPIALVLKELGKGNVVTPEMYQEAIKESLK